ncbi:DUF3224 domain-containing protein [Streptomyces sp. NPDC051051]|uniref:DUF3224 domain-containing protein n=1 Tax=Streptomyces sp. NPDC051051 TaxID=3155666 RepID=UPI00342F3A6A
MTTRATGTYTTKSWKENPYHKEDGSATLTRASVENGFTGDLAGDGILEYLMVYAADGTATYVGLQRFEGRLGEAQGTFVARIEGAFTSAAAETWTIVEGSGTGGLSGISGTGSVRSLDEKTAEYTVDYTL